MIKICHIISDTNIGGAGIYLFNLLSALDRRRFDISVILPRGSLLGARLRKLNGVAVYEADIRGDSSFSLSAILPLRRILKAISPDIVHTHASLSGRIAARLLSVPRVFVTRHSAWETGRFRGMKRILSSLLSRLFGDLYIATADAARRDLYAIGVPSDRTVTVRNGSPEKTRASESEAALYRSKLSIPRDAFVVTVTARLSKEKGVDTLIRAARKLLEKDGDFRFLIVGDGKERHALSALARNYGIEDKVIFTGFLADTAGVLSLSNILVSASRGTETSSLAISEAMSLGIPVVASDFGGNTEMVRDGENGLLFPVDNSSRLADCIERIRRNEALYERLSRGARTRYLREFTLSRMVHTYEVLYTLSLPPKPRGVKAEN